MVQFAKILTAFILSSSKRFKISAYFVVFRAERGIFLPLSGESCSRIEKKSIATELILDVIFGAYAKSNPCTELSFRLPGEPPKIIERIFRSGELSKLTGISIAGDDQPVGVARSAGRRRIDEYTVVLRGELQGETRIAVRKVLAG